MAIAVVPRRGARIRVSSPTNLSPHHASRRAATRAADARRRRLTRRRHRSSSRRHPRRPPRVDARRPSSRRDDENLHRIRRARLARASRSSREASNEDRTRRRVVSRARGAGVGRSAGEDVGRADGCVDGGREEFVRALVRRRLGGARGGERAREGRVSAREWCKNTSGSGISRRGCAIMIQNVATRRARNSARRDTKTLETLERRPTRRCRRRAPTMPRRLDACT